MRNAGWMLRLVGFLGGQSKITVWGTVVLSIAILGAIDYATGPEILISFFYIFPISLAGWSLGRVPGQVAALLSVLSMQGGNLLASSQPVSPLLLAWNTVIRLGVFLVVAALISEVRLLLEHQTQLSRIDPLTGILNRRAFYEAVDLELKKIGRYERPLTIGFMDLDDFKAVNDAEGHSRGDALLLHVARCLKQQLRGTDFIARIGGDEYAVLLPETDAAAAQRVVPRLQHAVLAEMAASNWAVTFSMGVLTCTAPPTGADDPLDLADRLMYAAKRDGKNCIEYAAYPTQPVAP